MQKPCATNVDSLRAELDAASPADRLDWIRSLGRKDQATLFAHAKGAVSVGDYHGETGEVVINEGCNNLPAFNFFQKRICLHGDQVQGYNENNVRWLVGPGHFQVRPSEDVEGEVWFDYYFEANDAPESFPTPSSNKRGVSFLVYANMIDVMRGVSEHVSVGRAIKNGKETGNYFVLCRT